MNRGRSGGGGEQRCPRSAYDRVGGLVYFARMLDKIRLHAAGRLPEAYQKNLGAGFDGRVVRFFRVEYGALRERALQGGTDDELLQWCLEQGRRPTEEEILVWNAFMTKRGWRDEAEQPLNDQKAASGLSHRGELVTFFDYFDVDEGRASSSKDTERLI